MSNLFEQIKNGEAKIGVIGLGYVGLPIALAFAKKVPVVGFDITDLDVDGGVSSDLERTQYGVKYAVSDQVSVALSYSETEHGDTSAKDEESTVLEVGYNLGGMGITLAYAQLENADGTDGGDSEGLILKTGLKF